MARRDLSAGAYQQGAADVPVTLRLRPAAHWVAEYYPVTSRETSGEDLIVTLPTSNEGFLRRPGAASGWFRRGLRATVPA
uniref:Uncharacterized protein n=1 Tax=Janibacter limosus TaxID=53458 RepID=A0AC61U7X8_9MICO|nr:hypothetical protein [Janibacter limosus]